MHGAGLAQMESLRARIAALEQRPVLAGRAAQLRASETAGRNDGLPMSPPGLLHEVFTDERRNAGAALGFTLGLARPLFSAERLAVIYLQLTAETQELGLPYGAGLKSFGFAPETLILGRIATITELLWAMEEAIACWAVAAVIADIAGHNKALDFTASRRLSLRAASAGTSVLLLRYGREREASAAKLRWKLSPLISGETMYDARAPGKPRWLAQLEKGRLGQHRAEAESFVLDWTEHGFELVNGDRAAERVAPAAALHGAAPVALGNRLSQTA